ncbi:hypothetical protein [Celeribacter marinus]|uniref:Uncharacterized protein n=1 Tax=Celeribacter marinus TaxID=1397108 RepID=A0A0N9ZJG7_9RHOB|nr:hypothetical protein [Celeribacter marinus]ALI55830.1 hypothetical protein IMCC12053_1883 [Celeribacter marinus]SFK90433.1 hypothetical protein SAMN05444421_11091 [Celeribacter marinus]
MKHTKFTAGLMALSLSVSAFAAPARASDEDVARAIGGLMTLFVIGKLIDESGKSKPAKAQVTHRRSDTLSRHDTDRRANAPRVKPVKRASHFDIPAQCIVTVDRRHGPDTSIAMERCLDKNRRSSAPLPNRCETDVHTRKGTVGGYDMSCLNKFGYEVAAKSRR